MTRQTVDLCDIKDCKQLSMHTYPLFVHGEQKTEDGFHAYVHEGKVDLCGKHEFEYRSSLPKLSLKADLATKEKKLA